MLGSLPLPAQQDQRAHSLKLVRLEGLVAKATPITVLSCEGSEVERGPELAQAS